MSGYIGTQPVPQATQTRQTFVATAAQTSFATGGYQAGYLDVFLNGVKLQDNVDYTATNGSDIVLTVGAAAGDTLEVVAYTAFEVLDQTFTGTTTTEGLTVTGAFTSLGIDDNATSTAMTLDSSGNVLVGKTSSSFSAVGIESRSGGTLWATADGTNPASFNRKTSDGAIAYFSKDGAPVGSIGVLGANEFYIEGPSNSSGIGFLPDRIVPRNSGVGYEDATQDIGQSNIRFKDLYLSGGVYLGGTGAANKLDDYEFGTWTPVLVGASGTPSYTLINARGYYVKVGKKVHVSMDWYATNVSGGTGDAYFTGLPFLQDSSQIGPTGPARLYQVGGYNPAVAIYGYSALALFVSQGPTNSVWRWGTVGDIQGTSIISASIDYLAV